MISQESYWGIAFAVLLAACCAMALLRRSAPLALHALTALAGCGLAMVSSLAYYFAAGIPAWGSAVVVPLFLSADLLCGAVVCPLFFRSGSFEGFSAVVQLSCLLAALACTAAFALHLLMLPVPDQTLLLACAAGIGIVAPALWILLAPVIGTRVGGAAKGKPDANAAGRPMPAARLYGCMALALCGVVLGRIAFFAAGVHM